MDRLKGAGAFLIVCIALFSALRLLNLSIPIFYPKVLAGPFSLDSIESAAEYTGFSPRLPFYRPAVLGTKPITITVTRRPYPKVAIFWHGDHFLYLTEQRGGEKPTGPPDSQPLPTHPESSWWREGHTIQAVLKLEDLWIEIRTDLSLQDVQRIIETLQPYERLR
jgi:hypothetical protein